MITLITFAVYTIISIYPVDFWKKSAYFVPTLLALYIFDNILLCPTSDNQFRSIPSPKELGSAAITAS